MWVGGLVAIDVLSLVWASSGRDQEALILVNYSLRKKGYSVKEASIFNWRYWLLKYNPRLLLLMSPTGAQINFKVARYASKRHIPVVTLVSEGLVEQDQQIMKWGHNEDRVLYARMNLQWSEAARNIIVKSEPLLAGRVKVSGGPGFDRYAIYRFMHRREFLSKYSKEYDAVIGVAGWNFATAHQYVAHTPAPEKHVSGAGFQSEDTGAATARFAQDRVELNAILDKMIETNPRILFLLKYRPNIIDKNATEFRGLRRHSNVVEIKDEEAVANCINVSDFWIAYESTTCLEAWLLNKQTVCINPSGPDFAPRSAIYMGAPVCESIDEVQTAIDSFYASQKIPGFAELLQIRQQIIKDSIQWADGKNHMRIAYLIEQALNDSVDHARPALPLYDRLKGWVANLAFRGARYFPGLPVLKRFAHAHSSFDERQLKELEDKYQPSIKAFHRVNQLTEADLLELEKINE